MQSKSGRARLHWAEWGRVREGPGMMDSGRVSVDLGNEFSVSMQRYIGGKQQGIDMCDVE